MTLHHTGAARAHDWACERLAAWFRSTTLHKPAQSQGAQDLVAFVLDLSFRRYRAGAAPRNWQRNGELLHPGNPDKDLDEKAARKIAK